MVDAPKIPLHRPDRDEGCQGEKRCSNPTVQDPSADEIKPARLGEHDRQQEKEERPA